MKFSCSVYRGSFFPDTVTVCSVVYLSVYIVISDNCQIQRSALTIVMCVTNITLCLALSIWTSFTCALWQAHRSNWYACTVPSDIKLLNMPSNISVFMLCAGIPQFQFRWDICLFTSGLLWHLRQHIIAAYLHSSEFFWWVSYELLWETSAWVLSIFTTNCCLIRVFFSEIVWQRCSFVVVKWETVYAKHL